MAVSLATLQMDPPASFAPAQESGPLSRHAASEATVSGLNNTEHLM